MASVATAFLVLWARVRAKLADADRVVGWPVLTEVDTVIDPLGGAAGMGSSSTQALAVVDCCGPAHLRPHLSSRASLAWDGTTMSAGPALSP